MDLKTRVVDLSQQVLGAVPSVIRDTALIRFFGFAKVPLLFHLRPTVRELTLDGCRVRIPLNRRTKNHLNSMYFAVLAAGADAAGGLIAMKQIFASPSKIDLIFKDFHADFHKRAEGDVDFVCLDGRKIGDLVTQAEATDERQECKIQVKAFVPTKLGDEPVASFTLTLSLKKRKTS